MSQLTLQIKKQPIDAPMALVRSAAPIAGAILIALLVHGIGTKAGAYPSRVMLDCGVAIIAAVSLTIVNGFTGQFSIGHAAFMAVGGYASGMLTYYTLLRGMEPSQIRALEPSLFGGMQWVLAAACMIGGLVSAFAGWLVGLPSLRLKGDYLAIVTLGFGEIVRVLLTQTGPQVGSVAELREKGFFSAFLPPAANGALGFADLPKVTNLFWTYLFVGATILIAYRIKTSSYGRALLSIREDEIAAESMGVNTARMKIRAFVLAAFLAGVAGTLYAHIAGNNLSPLDAGFARSFDFVMMVVLGGLGSISGSTLAACIIICAGEWLRAPTHIWPAGVMLAAGGLVATARHAPVGHRWPVRIGGIVVAALTAAIVGAAMFGPTASISPLRPIGRLLDTLGHSTWVGVSLLVLVVAMAIVVRRFFSVVGLYAVPLLTLLFTLFIELVRALAIANGYNLGDYRMVFFALMLILMMIFRPKGLFGLYEVWDYLTHPQTPSGDPSQKRGFEVRP